MNRTTRHRLSAFATALLLARLGALPAAESSPDAAAQRMGRYNVVWNTPSKDASGVMPIGNGDIAAGVYAIENGDLYLLLAKNDAYNYMGDISRPAGCGSRSNPIRSRRASRSARRSTWPTGSIRIEADGVKLRIWADANRPVYHVEVHSPREIAVTARPEFWKRFDCCSSTSTKCSHVASQPSRPRMCGWIERAKCSGISPSATAASIPTI